MQPVEITIVVSTLNGLSYWDTFKDEWMSIHAQWPRFHLIIVSHHPRNIQPTRWVQFAFAGKPSHMARRFLGFSIATAPSVLFLNDESMISAKTLVQLAAKMASTSDSTLIAGIYSADSTMSSRARANIEVCNMSIAGQPRFLNGAFCLPNSSFMHELTFGESKSIGSVDDRMAAEILRLGGSIEHFPDLQVRVRGQTTFLQLAESTYNGFKKTSVRTWPRIVKGLLQPYGVWTSASEDIDDHAPQVERLFP